MHLASSPAPDRSAALLAEHYPLARAVAARMHRRLPPGVDVDDLISVAVMGLMEACSRFDPARGVAFRTFAKHRMHGAMLDALRAGDWVPRSVRGRARAVDVAASELREALGRSPTSSEIATRLELDVEEVRSARAADLQPMLSLDAPFDEHDDGGAMGDSVPTTEEPPDAAVERRQVQDLVVAAVSGLPGRERMAIELFYLEGIPLKQVGATLGVSESRACQLCSQGTKRLRTALVPMVG